MAVIAAATLVSMVFLMVGIVACSRTWPQLDETAIVDGVSCGLVEMSTRCLDDEDDLAVVRAHLLSKIFPGKRWD